MAGDPAVGTWRRRRRVLLALLVIATATGTIVQGVGLNALAALISPNFVREHLGLFLAVVVVVTVLLVGASIIRIQADGRSPAETPPTPANAPPAPSQHPAPERVREGGVHNLGPHNPYFTGRADLLRQLDQLLMSRQHAWVAIYGLGGIGKSELARELCHRLAAHYEVVWFVGAGQPAATRAALRDLARHLELPVGGDRPDGMAALVAELDRRGRWLLVYDGASGPADVVPLLPTSGSGQVLITSRDPAWGANALAVQVPCLSRADARAFLLTGTRSRDGSAADELAEELGRLPLALSQAVAYINHHPDVTLRGYLDRYRKHHRQLLEDEDGQAFGYLETVTTTWQLALQELSERKPAAVQLLRLLAFLAADTRIPRSLLRASPGHLPPALRSAVGDLVTLDKVTGALLRHGLITADEDGFQVHRLVQTVTRDHLFPRQCAQWAGRAAELLVASLPDNPGKPEHWPPVDQLLPHALAVIGHTEDQRQHPELLRMLGVYFGSMDRSRDELWEAHQHLRRALELTVRQRGRRHPAVAHIRSNLGAVLCELGDPASAKKELDRAVAILSRNDRSVDPLQKGSTLNNRGLVCAHLGDLGGAQEAFEQAIKLLEDVFGPDSLEVATPRANLGSVLSERGEHPRAIELLEWALRVQTAAYEAENLELARTRVDLGRALYRWGDMGGARRQLHCALTTFELSYGPQHPKVRPIAHDLGVVLLRRGRLWSGLQRARQGGLPHPVLPVLHRRAGGPPRGEGTRREPAGQRKP